MRHFLILIFILCFVIPTIAQPKTFQDSKFIYKLITSYQIDEERGDTNCFVKQIIVIDKTNHKTLQKIAVPENGFFCDTKSLYFKIEDMNFDNYNDFRLRQFPSGTPNVPYYYWIYKPKLHKFVRDSTLEEITSPDFDAKNKTITSFWRASASDHGFSTYKYIKDKVTLIEEEEDYRDPNSSNIYISVTRQLIKGKMLVVDSTIDVDMSIVPEESTLDSLQGFWVSTSDSLNKMLVNGRVCIQCYAYEDLANKKDTSSIFFSDTLIAFFKNETLNELSYDSSKTSGEYLILASKNSRAFWCYKIEGFWKNEYEKRLSIIDTWAKRRKDIFKIRPIKFLKTL